MSQQTSIAFVSVDTPTPYGSTQSFLQILNDHAESGKPGCVFVLAEFGSILEQAEKLDVPSAGYIYTWHEKKGKFRKLLLFVLQKMSCLLTMMHFFVKSECDVVYLNTCFFTLPALAGWLTRRPVVLHMRDSPHYLRSGGFYRKIRAWVLRNCVTRYIAISHHAAADLKSTIGVMHTDVVYNGINVEWFDRKNVTTKDVTEKLSLCENDRLVVCVNRFDPLKGIEDFLRTVKVVEKLSGNVRFALVGGPIDTPYYNDTIRPLLSETHSVTVLPYQSDVRPFLVASDIVLNTTQFEQFGRLNVEAMALGCCVVSRSVGAIPEIVDDGRTGVLFDADGIDSLAELVVQLLDAPMLRRRIGEAAAEVVRARFDAVTYSTRVRELLQENARRYQ